MYIIFTKTFNIFTCVRTCNILYKRYVQSVPNPIQNLVLIMFFEVHISRKLNVPKRVLDELRTKF